MRRTWFLVVLAMVAFAGGCSGDVRVETATGGAQATTTSTLPPAITTPFVPPLPPGMTAGGGDTINVHSPILSFVPGQTSWTSTSSPVTVTVRIDKVAPKAGEPVAFEVVVSSAQACCRVELRPGWDASFMTEGGLSCLPLDAANTRSATFRWVHVYPQSGRFTLSVIGRAGLCSEPAATGGVTGTIEIA